MKTQNIPAPATIGLTASATVGRIRDAHRGT